MELVTKVNIQERSRKLGLDNKIMIIGSCFANEIGNILKSCGFNISVNPFGTLYNPISIANSIQRLASATPFEQKEVINISLHSTSEATDTKPQIHIIGPKSGNSAHSHITALLQRDHKRSSSQVQMEDLPKRVNTSKTATQ